MALEESLINLEELGWDSSFAEDFRRLDIRDIIPARVISQERESYQVYAAAGELTAYIAGRMRRRRDEKYPVVGDWVAVQPQAGENKGVIQSILPRKSKFSRQIAGGRQRLSGGSTREQVVAANVDTVFLVSGLDGGRNLNLRSTERYLVLAWDSGAQPVIVLNKTDLCPDVKTHVRDMETIATSVPVHAVSARYKSGLDDLQTYLTRGKTAALLGPSGVGKSALINALLGIDRQEIGDVRDTDRRGRHTTTRRELILLPGGGNVIDTPGMREIQVRGGEESLDDAFDDISYLAQQCRFKDCSHGSEPGCAVQAAIKHEDLDIARFQSYQKLQQELKYQAARQEGRLRLEEKARWKKISQWARQFKKGE